MIIPVHIGGYPVDMDPIMALAKQHDIVVLEDAAHAFGGEYKHRKLGTIGDLARSRSTRSRTSPPLARAASCVPT